MPVLHAIFAELPAQLHQLAVAIGGKVDQALERPFELDAHAVQVCNSLEQLHLGAADRVARLLLPLKVLSACAGSFRFVLGDAGLVLQLRQEGRELGDLLHDPAHSWQLVVRLLHGICAEPLHGSTIAKMTGAHPSVFRWRQTSVMDSTEMRRRAQAARVARLATVDAGGRPHIVPICFVLVDETLYFAIDAKPKSTTNLKRLRNIAGKPNVSILIDHYENDWSRLWWVRLDGSARIVTADVEIERAMDLLVQRYAQYRATRPPGPVVAVEIDSMSGWSAA